MSAQVSSSATLDAIMTQIVTNYNPNSLNHIIRGSISRDVREAVLAGSLASGQDPLSVLDMRVNTLAVLYILSARLNSSIAPAPPVSYVRDFCRLFIPEQAHLAPERVTMLAKGIVRLADIAGSPKYAIQPLFDLLTRFSPSPSHLTSVHPVFLQVCLKTRHFAPALPILANPISQLGPDLTYNDNLVFHYTGGLILAALKRWSEAEEWLEICVSAPAVQPAALQMDALKRLICVQLISKGKATSLPKYTNGHLVRMIKTTPYNFFMMSYPAQIEKLRLVLDKERQLFISDRTLGLLTQALDHAPRWQIKKLTGTYLTLGLSEIGKRLGISNEGEVRRIILSMIETSEISAQISASGIVTFSDVTTPVSYADLEKVLRDAEEQAALLKRLETDMGTSKEFLSKAIKTRDDSAWGSLPEEESLFGPAPAGGWLEEAPFT